MNYTFHLSSSNIVTVSLGDTIIETLDVFSASFKERVGHYCTLGQIQFVGDFVTFYQVFKHFLG